MALVGNSGTVLIKVHSNNKTVIKNQFLAEYTIKQETVHNILNGENRTYHKIWGFCLFVAKIGIVKYYFMNVCVERKYIRYQLWLCLSVKIMVVFLPFTPSLPSLPSYH